MISIRLLRWLALMVILSTQLIRAQSLDASRAFTVPAGTRIITQLRSPLHTTSAISESGVYLESLEPIVIDNRVAIPAHSLIQGTVEMNKRPGHFDRRSQLRFHFTTLILPNNQVAAIDAILLSIPGTNYRKKDLNGTTGTVDQAEKTLPEISALAFTGAVLGSVSHVGIGGFGPGAALGAALGLGKVLLRRGDAIALHEGSRVEIQLRAPVSLTSERTPTGLGIIAPRQNAAEQVGSLNQEEAPQNAPHQWPISGLNFLPWY